MTPPAQPRPAPRSPSTWAAPRPVRPRRGLSGVELLVILGVAAFFGLLILVALPRGRETARVTGCERNLMQVGLGLQLYAQASRHYPTSPAPGQAGASPVRAMLDALALPDFLDLSDPTTSPKPGEPPRPGARVPGLVCPSDPNGGAGGSPTALSYRASAGSRPAGSDGPFSPGILLTPARVEAANGLGYTAAFAERLLGTGREGQPGAMNYQLIQGPILRECPAQRSDAHFWQGDAGASWSDPGWRSALYTHSLELNAQRNCLATDGLSANMTASSAHPGRVNVALLDGSVRAIKPSVDPTVWRRLGTIETPPADEAAPTP